VHILAYYYVLKIDYLFPVYANITNLGKDAMSIEELMIINLYNKRSFVFEKKSICDTIKPKVSSSLQNQSLMPIAKKFL
jgi:hypothetical protein